MRLNLSIVIDYNAASFVKKYCLENLSRAVYLGLQTKLKNSYQSSSSHWQSQWGGSCSVKWKGRAWKNLFLSLPRAYPMKWLKQRIYLLEKCFSLLRSVRSRWRWKIILRKNGTVLGMQYWSLWQCNNTSVPVLISVLYQYQYWWYGVIQRCLSAPTRWVLSADSLLALVRPRVTSRGTTTSHTTTPRLLSLSLCKQDRRPERTFSLGSLDHPVVTLEKA